VEIDLVDLCLITAAPSKLRDAVSLGAMAGLDGGRNGFMRDSKNHRGIMPLLQQEVLMYAQCTA
jgi:hypothetical protein